MCLNINNFLNINRSYIIDIQVGRISSSEEIFTRIIEFCQEKAFHIN